MKTKATRSREYLVADSIARAGTYRIAAGSKEEAEALACIEGEFLRKRDVQLRSARHTRGAAPP